MTRSDTSRPSAWTLGPALLLTLACVLWAGSSVAAKVALPQGGEPAAGKVGPYTLATVRFGLAGLILLVFVVLRREWRPVPVSDQGRFVALGMFGIALTYAVFYGGMQYTTATETTLLVAAEPVLIAVLARIVLGERMKASQVGGMCFGLTGVYLIVMRGWLPTLEGTVLANGVVTLALVFESLSSVIGKGLTRSYPGLQVATLGMLTGAGTLFPFAVWENLAGRSHMPGFSETIAIGYLTLICSALCYGIWYALLKRHTLSSMAGFLFIQPVLGPVFGYILLGERIGVWTVLGAVLVVLGVWFVAGHAGKSEAQPVSTDT